MSQTSEAQQGRRLYPISGSDRYSIFPGVLQDGCQVLMGLYCPSLVAVCFDCMGKLLGGEYRRLSYLNLDAWMVDDCRFLDDLRAWQDQLGFRPTTIRVEKFSFVDTDSNPDAISPDWPVHIEIRDPPEYFAEVLSDSSGYGEFDKEAVRREMAEWEREGRFVLYWRVSKFWVEQSGRF